MKFFDSLHESANAYCVRAGRCRVSTARIAHKLLCTVVHGIKLSNLVAESNSLEQSLDLVSLAWQLEVIFADTQLCEGRREQKVNSLWLISIILYLIAWNLEITFVELIMNLHCNQRLISFPCKEYRFLLLEYRMICSSLLVF